jgi:hypothetical protein
MGDAKTACPKLNEEELQSKNGSDNDAAEAVPEHELQSMDAGSDNDAAVVITDGLYNFVH